MKRNKTRDLVMLSMFICIELVLMFTPLGYVPIGPLRATTMHIPVILAGILLGRNQGALVGFIFGLSSIFVNTFTPTVVSFVFSPFYSLGEFSGNINSVIIALVPRILLGYGSGMLNDVVKINNNDVKEGIIAITMTLMHTILVMSGIYVFFGSSYASAKDIAYETLMKVIVGVITTNGIMEAILAGIVVVVVCKAIRHVRRV